MSNVNKFQQSFRTFIFLVLSLLSGFFEIGGVLWAIREGKEVYIIIGIGLLYQLGNLVPVPIKINKVLSIIFSIISFGAGILMCIDPEKEMLIMFIMCFNACVIQHLRSLMKDKVGTTIKRVFRVLGFLIAPFFSILTCVICTALLLIVACIGQSGEKPTLVPCKVRSINVIMIFHQMHYFGYVYFMLIILNKYVTLSDNFILSVIFVIGWITYLIVPHILKGKNYVKYFICGHILLALILLGLSAFYNLKIAAILWMLTGFGGGTVFCIKKINDDFGISGKNDIILSENIGHIGGTFLGLVCYYTFNSLQAPIIFSMLCAIVAFVGMIILSLRKKVKKSK